MHELTDRQKLEVAWGEYQQAQRAYSRALVRFADAPTHPERLRTRAMLEQRIRDVQDALTAYTASTNDLEYNVELLRAFVSGDQA